MFCMVPALRIFTLPLMTTWGLGPSSPAACPVNGRRFGWKIWGWVGKRSVGSRWWQRGQGYPWADGLPSPFGFSLPRASVSPQGWPASPGDHGNLRMLPRSGTQGTRHHPCSPASSRRAINGVRHGGAGAARQRPSPCPGNNRGGIFDRWGNELLNLL